MLFATLIISFVSILLLINLIFDIRCSCKYRTENNVESESSDENFIPTNESSDEQEEVNEKPRESFKVDCIEHCSKSCLCKAEHEEEDEENEEDEDEIPPLVYMNTITESVPLPDSASESVHLPDSASESAPESTLRDQIIN